MYDYPGVFVSESLRPPNTGSAPPGTVGALVGAINRGPLTPTKLESWTQFNRLYGGFVGNTDIAHAAYAYFNNGGRDLWAVRAIGTGAVTASRIFTDGNATTPTNVLTVFAANPGAWANGDSVSNGIFITVEVNVNVISLIVKFGGTDLSNIVERWTELSLDPNSDRFAERVVNSASSGSNYIVVDVLSNILPAAQTNTSLAGGVNGASPTPTEMETAYRQLDSVEDSLVLAAPGNVNASVVNGLVTYAANRQDSFVVIDSPPGLTPSQAVDFITSVNPADSHGAVYYPWVNFVDPSTSSRDATRLIAPSGAVMGQYARTDATRGIFKAPAGLGARLNGAVSLERALTSGDLRTLNNNHVNTIRHIPGSGLVVMGARTLKRRQADKYIPVRRTLIYLKRAMIENTRFAVFEVNDEALWSQIRANLSQFLADFWTLGGLRGQSASEAFYVKCDGELNTGPVIESGEVRVEVGVALQYPAEFVVIRIGQTEGGGATTEVAA